MCARKGRATICPFALGLMASVGQVPAEKLSRYVLVGELGLDGSIRPIKGALSIAIKAREQQYEGLIVPRDNVREAAVVNKLKVYGADHLQQVIDFFQGRRQPATHPCQHARRVLCRPITVPF